jgi:hypothetical protein
MDPVVEQGGSTGGSIAVRLPPPAAKKMLLCRTYADVAQLVEHFTRNEGVPGSSPGVGSGFIEGCSILRTL